MGAQIEVKIALHILQRLISKLGGTPLNEVVGSHVFALTRVRWHQQELVYGRTHSENKPGCVAEVRRSMPRVGIDNDRRFRNAESSQQRLLHFDRFRIGRVIRMNVTSGHYDERSQAVSPTPRGYVGMNSPAGLSPIS